MDLREFENFNDSVLLPVQYHGRMAGRSPNYEGERRLLWALPEEAIRTYVTNARRVSSNRRREFEEVRRWFQGRGCEGGGLFAFRNICDLLGIEPEWLLRGLESAAASGALPAHRRTVVRTQTLARTAA